MRHPCANYGAVTALFVTLIMFFTKFENLGTSEDTLYGAPSHLENSLAPNGSISMDKARGYCQTPGWDPYPYRNHRRKIYDLYIISLELD